MVKAMKTAFLFVGQGAQIIGMGRDFYDAMPEIAELFDNAKLDFDIKALCFEGPEDKLTNTAYVQACLLLTSYAMAESLRHKGITPDVVAGLSLGEYTALTYAGVFSLADALKIVRKRGQLMADALPAGTGMMAAVMGAEEEKIHDACTKASSVGVCEVANYNCPGQIVISGETEAVKLACADLKSRGVRRVMPLKVSGAFHSSLLKEASSELREVLDQVKIKQPAIPVVTNVTGDYIKGSIPENLTKQMYSSVYFEKGIRTLIADGVDTFVEIGPGKALSGFVKKIDKTVTVLNVEDLKSCNHTLEILSN